MRHRAKWNNDPISFCIALLFALVASAQAERLPIKTYTMTDGLASNRIHRIVQDSRGFIWFCTVEGLSRFDGYSFVNYTIDDGLPYHSINDLLETPDGDYWLASNGAGVIRFAPKSSAQKTDGRSRFAVYPVGDTPVTNRVNVLCRDRNGRLWAGTDGGVYILDEKNGESEFHRVELGLASHADETVQVWTLLEDREGSLWMGTKFGLVRCLPDERIIHYPVQPSKDSDIVRALLKDRNDRLWVGHQAGLIVVNPAALAVTPPTSKTSIQNLESAVERQAYAAVARLAGSGVVDLFQASDGTIWIGSSTGLIQFSEGHLQNYTTAQGLDGKVVSALKEDGEGSLWVGTNDNGVTRIYRNGFTLYGKADGLGQVIGSMIETPAGEFCVTSSDYAISRFDGRRFITAKVNVTKKIGLWRRYHNVMEDHTGEWWAATANGLYHFPKVSDVGQLARVRPNAVYTTADGLAGNDLTALFEDSRGDMMDREFCPQPGNAEPLGARDANLPSLYSGRRLARVQYGHRPLRRPHRQSLGRAVWQRSGALPRRPFRDLYGSRWAARGNYELIPRPLRQAVDHDHSRRVGAH